MASSSKCRKVDNECRSFQEKWTNDNFSVLHKEKPICLICNESVAVLKEYNIKRHFTTKHSQNFDRFSGQIRTDKIEKLKKNLLTQQNIFLKQHQEGNDIARASFVVSQMIAKHSKPFSEGEFVKQCLTSVAHILCPDKEKKFAEVSLTRRTVTRRIEMMGENIKFNLAEILKKGVAFSIALDDSTDITDTAQLAIYFCSCCRRKLCYNGRVAST